MTLFGVVDLGYQSTKATVNGIAYKASTMASGTQSGSRVGFKGTEDLGGGLKVNFHIEGGVTPDDSNLTWSNRQSFVGLEGDFGTLNLGRQYTLHHSNQGEGDMLGNVGNAGYIGGLDSLVRANNAITYTSPSFSGIKAAAQMALGETVTSGVGKKLNELTAFRLTYANGPIAAGFATENVKNALAAIGEIKFADQSILKAPGVDKRNANNMFASYDLGVAKLSLVNNSSKFTSAGTPATKWKASTMSVSAPMGAVTLFGSFGSGKITSEGTTDNIKLDTLQLGASYTLSKRTNAYVFVGQTKSKATGDTVDKLSQGVLGVRHSF